MNERRGILLYHLMVFLHFGQTLLPLVNEIPLAMRQLTEEIKEPKINPKIKSEIYSRSIYIIPEHTPHR
jgi:hypothetical protein